MSETEIRKLSRWDMISAVRALSTKELHSGNKSRALTRFARVSHSSGAEQQRHYQQEVQRIFDLQNRVLASTEVLSTDTDSSSSEEENDEMMDWMCQGIENLLEGKTNSRSLQRKKEKQDYQELKQLMLRDGRTHLQDKGKKEQQDRGSTTSAPVSLVIYRTYIDESGKEYVQKEIIRDPAVIKLYTHVKSTKDEDFIRKTFPADEEKQQEIRKKKKRLQDRLRRIRIAEERKQQREERKEVPPEKLPKPEVPKLNLIGEDCGSHIKTKKTCPKYCPPKDLTPRLKGSRKQEDRELAKQLPQKSLIQPLRTRNFMERKHKFENTNAVQRETIKVKVKKRPLPLKRKSDTPQKRRRVHMDPSEGFSCIRHPCQPALPCPPSKRCRKSPPVLSPQVPLEKPEKTSGNLLAEPPQKTPPSPVHLAQSKSESPSQLVRKNWGLQNWLQQKYRSLTQPCQKEPDNMIQPQKPVIPLAKEGPVSSHLLSHSAKKSQNPLTCSKPLFHNSSGKQCKRPRNSLCQPNQKLSQEPTIACKQVPQDILGRSLQRHPLDKDTQPSSCRNQVPQGYCRTECQSIKTSILYEDLQVSDTDEEEEKEEI
ncbi:transcription initiation factor TFIID subunit 1-like [Sarcophilus harrisii]|uniref:transcription initiation factor TFIID subunit 1-like n=1 Tax=Sarcophilus harrisii TaxID=9305 RepID=UPI001301CE75|nr:transcription initiation factor TFIID subunit 1-like [Sarcophilus harrisii]